VGDEKTKRVVKCEKNLIQIGYVLCPVFEAPLAAALDYTDRA
jgi:hypothetical protein